MCYSILKNMWNILDVRNPIYCYIFKFHKILILPSKLDLIWLYPKHTYIICYYVLAICCPTVVAMASAGFQGTYLSV